MNSASKVPPSKCTQVYSTNNQLRADTTAFCLHRSNEIDYMELRLWIGLHSCLQCFLLVVSDASYIIKYMTRFTEEGFSSLISFIFISDAIKKMVGNMLSDVQHLKTPGNILALKWLSLWDMLI